MTRRSCDTCNHWAQCPPEHPGAPRYSVCTSTHAPDAVKLGAIMVDGETVNCRFHSHHDATVRNRGLTRSQLCLVFPLELDGR